ncbi:DEKNAAC103466 [Brettanomyces naardenensis]|uniref:Glucosidase II subunit alpha n=1 Tax=Brettanomyces naardenensis TaxID=13370 RepID=A0A448YNU6_BRENA|nr:DEKNAAC103466 [Brettanomyces naardenensis]
MPDRSVFLLLFIFLLVILPVPSEAVKDYLFKKCDQSGFCHRNRHFANEILEQGDSYQPRYSIDLATLQIDDQSGTVDGILLKQLNDGTYVDLSLKIAVITDHSLRLTVDEIDRDVRVGGNVTTPVNKVRYNEASTWAFDGKDPKQLKFTHELQSDSLILHYGDYNAQIQLYPFKISLSYKGAEQLIVNERSLLNVEHYRTKVSEDDANSNDVAPEESTFGSYSDSFKDSKGDTLPLGPESVALDFGFVGYNHVYGIPEHADSLSLKDTTDGEPYRLFNVDIFEYPVQDRYQMYGSIPFMVAVKPGSSAGIFWVNSADTYVDIKKNGEEDMVDERKIIIENSSRSSSSSVQTHWMSENGVLDVILMVKDTPAEISRAYGSLTGYVSLPNMFSIGYHQSRWNYNDEKDVLDVAGNFDSHMIPCDAIWLDIEYAEGKKYFTWNKDAFPNPERMEAKLNETGKKLVAIIDPHLKTGYSVSDGVVKERIAIRNADSKDAYKGHSWPGESVWIDTLNPRAQLFWNKQFANGSQLMGYSTNLHIWNDMNEPSIFNGPETSAPKDLLHYGNWEHRSVHNLFGLTYHEATYNSLIERNSHIRPFILTRSFFAGSQRTCAMWTGDNMARWEYLRESIRMCLTMNVAGFPFAGADVGGFFHNPDMELLVRWYQTGIWYPFFRAHSHIDSRRREPFLLDEPYQDYIKEALLLRYKLLPVLYTQFYKASQTGLPIMKPIFYDSPEDVGSYSIDDEFFIGDLLVRPVMEENQTRVSVYLPDEKRYYSFFNLSTSLQGKGEHDDVEAELDQIPLYLREGSILPTKQRYRRSTKLMTYDPYTLYVVIDSDGHAGGDLYIDDGESFDYRDNEDHLYLSLSVEKGKTISSKVIKGDSAKPFVASLSRTKVESIVLVGAKNVGSTVTVHQGGKSWEAEVLREAPGIVVIRNPKMSINSAWTVEI